MSSSKKEYFLGKGGQVFGPFSQEQIENLRLSAEIEAYTYMWNDETGQWHNLDPIPPAPGGQASAHQSGAQNMSLDAICHNSQDLVSGRMENISDLGCELVSSNHSEAPQLGANSSCILNVMDGAKQRAVNIKARMVETCRRNGRWVYRLRWARRPTF